MFAGAVVGLRFLVVPAWIAAALAVTLWLPGLGSGEPLPLGGLIPENAESAQVAQRDAEIFGVPLTTDTLVVQRNADGLSPAAQAKAVARALAVSRAPKQAEGIQLALPIANTLGLFPSSREHGTTAITYLYFGPEASLSDRVAEAEAYASQIPADDAPVGVTGPAPARDQQFREMEDALPIVEAGTVLVILLVVGLTFQAFGAPLLTLFAAAISFLVARGLIPWVGTRLGVEIPQEVEPLVVALTLGIVTDYAVFYLSGMRRSLLEGRSAVESAMTATIRVTPIVATAGLIVVAGTASLLVGELDFFRAFGPGLAMTAAVALVVSITLIPAMLAILGRLVFWPGYDEADREDHFASPTRGIVRPLRFVPAGRTRDRPPLRRAALPLRDGSPGHQARHPPDQRPAGRHAGGSRSRRSRHGLRTGDHSADRRGRGGQRDRAGHGGARRPRAGARRPARGGGDPRPARAADPAGPRRPLRHGGRKRRALRASSWTRIPSELLRSTRCARSRTHSPACSATAASRARRQESPARPHSHPTPCRRWWTPRCASAPSCSSSTSSCSRSSCARSSRRSTSSLRASPPWRPRSG